MAEMRPFDKQLLPLLLWGDKKTGHRFTANAITHFRLVTLTLFSLAHWFAPAYPIICLVDSFCDLADGAFARQIRKGPNGDFLDQAWDKLSNHGRKWTLWALLPAGFLIVDTEIYGFSAFWMLMAITTGIDLILLLLRVVNFIYPKTKPPVPKDEQTSVSWGKAKVFPQQFGIVLFAVAYANTMGWPLWLMMTTSFIGAAGMAAMIPSDIRFTWLYRAGIMLLFVLSFPQVFDFGIPFHTGIALGQFAFVLSLPLAAMSLRGQILRYIAWYKATRQAREKSPLQAPAKQ